MVLVLGASQNTSRYSYLATEKLLAHGYEVFLVGKQEGEVLGEMINTNIPYSLKIHTVTIYVNPSHQIEWEPIIIEKIHPQRVIFNPGTENPDFERKLTSNGIEVLRACTLVMLSSKQF